ncbi:hypothetical protein G6011_05444 [Alternaria panax]|uniref:PhoD-like phosphatase metallophosphatase domain-containing protein n=1 Tax=Alternaria panax TaxID=48097 RepID=A0AAD4I6I4_9PLEO|nr:hypothetical protein G6011_05444 [Alternaria panax]
MDTSMRTGTRPGRTKWTTLLISVTTSMSPPKANSGKTHEPRIRRERLSHYTVANNGYRDGFSNMNNTEQSFRKFGGVSVDLRKMNAVQAYFDWMPICQVDMEMTCSCGRRGAKMSKSFDLIMLDTRNYDRSITTLNWNDDYIANLKDGAAHSLMDSHQENWFHNQLSESHERGATWTIIFSRMNNSAVYDEELNANQWDGYTANRNRTLHHLHSNEVPNTAFLTGDSHANWVSDLV